MRTLLRMSLITLRKGGPVTRSRLDFSSSKASNTRAPSGHTMPTFTSLAIQRTLEIPAGAFANALLGNFQRYQQFSKTLLEDAPYWNIEWYGQDTWKVTPKLTLNYGLRVNLVPPIYEKNNLFTNFDPAVYDPSKKVVLYQPALVNGQRG